MHKQTQRVRAGTYVVMDIAYMLLVLRYRIASFYHTEASLS